MKESFETVANELTQLYNDIKKSTESFDTQLKTGVLKVLDYNEMSLEELKFYRSKSLNKLNTSLKVAEDARNELAQIDSLISSKNKVAMFGDILYPDNIENDLIEE